MSAYVFASASCLNFYQSCLVVRDRQFGRLLAASVQRTLLRHPAYTYRHGSRQPTDTIVFTINLSGSRVEVAVAVAAHACA